MTKKFQFRLNRNQISRRKDGFTLIELLVVIAIIGILAGFLMVNFIGARQQARDGQRKNDLRQIQIALEAYRSSNATGYPSSITCEGAITVSSVEYMKKVPRDPSTSDCTATPQYTYTPTLSGTTYTSYTLKACLENENDSDKDSINTCATGYSITFTNP